MNVNTFDTSVDVQLCSWKHISNPVQRKEKEKKDEASILMSVII